MLTCAPLSLCPPPLPLLPCTNRVVAVWCRRCAKATAWATSRNRIRSAPRTRSTKCAREAWASAWVATSRAYCAPRVPGPPPAGATSKCTSQRWSWLGHHTATHHHRISRSSPLLSRNYLINVFFFNLDFSYIRSSDDISSGYSSAEPGLSRTASMSNTAAVRPRVKSKTREVSWYQSIDNIMLQFLLVWNLVLEHLRFSSNGFGLMRLEIDDQ